MSNKGYRRNKRNRKNHRNWRNQRNQGNQRNWPRNRKPGVLGGLEELEVPRDPVELEPLYYK